MHCSIAAFWGEVLFACWDKLAFCFHGTVKANWKAWQNVPVICAVLNPVSGSTFLTVASPHSHLVFHYKGAFYCFHPRTLTVWVPGVFSQLSISLDMGIFERFFWNFFSLVGVEHTYLKIHFFPLCGDFLSFFRANVYCLCLFHLAKPPL